MLIFSEKPEELAAFYTKVLQKEPDWMDGGYYGYSAGASFLTIGPHDKVKGKSTNPERVMINFEVEDVKQEFGRLKDLGTTVIVEPYQMEEGSEGWIATLADPDGNYFQLMPPWEG